MDNYADYAQQIASNVGKERVGGWDDEYVSYEFKYEGLEVITDSKSNPDHVAIKYEGYPVFIYNFSSYRNIEERKKIGIVEYKPGPWEELFLEIYRNLDFFIRKKEAEERKYKLKEKHSNDLLKALDKQVSITENREKRYLIHDCYNLKLFPENNGTFNIDEIGIKLVTFLNRYERSSGCGYDEYYRYQIYSNDELCCEFTKANCGKIESTISQFVIGPWEQKLIEYITNKELLEQKQKLEKEADEVKNSILKLKKQITNGF